MRTPRSPFLLASLLVVTLTACGGGGQDAEPAEATTFTGGSATFVGTGAIAWEAEQIQAETVDGQLDATIVCEGAVPHNLIIEGVEGDEELLRCEGNDQDSATIAIEPGTYQFWCDIPGHRSAGMEGVLELD